MLAAFFENKPHMPQLPFVAKSKWTPALSQLPVHIRKFMIANKYAYNTLNWHTTKKPNLTSAEFHALKELQMDNTIVIKPADKGSVTVIVDRADYIYEAKRQLNDSNYYSKLEAPIYMQNVPRIRNILEELQRNKFITSKQKDYLMGSDTPRNRRFYLLPKIHKPPDKWSIPFKIPPGRPIVSDCGSETYQIAEYIDSFLQPISIKHPSYLRDSYDFIDKIKSQRFPQNCILFSLDVDNLYTNIETEQGLQAVQEWFTRHPDPKRPDTQLLQLLEMSLTKNDFEFNSEYYLQIKGTAMGKKFAPAYANIYMANWEETALNATPIKPLSYYRFLDDIWGIWNDSEESFISFVNDLNSHHPSITLKHTISSSEINFLDILTYKGPKFGNTGILDFKVFFKETDTHALLHHSSHHPQHIFKGIVKSQLLRFHRICTREDDFWQATQTLFRALRKRGYSRTFLRKALKSFKEKGTKKVNEEILPIITSFSAISQELNSKIKTNFAINLANTRTLKKFKLISAYRRNKNLKDILVHTKLKSLRQEKTTSGCPEFQFKQWVMNKKTKQVFQIRPFLNSQTLNCVYLIYCIKCPAQYVGETRNSIACRVTQHRYNIRKQKEIHTKLVQHFLSHGLEALRVTGLQSNILWTTWQRRRCESFWIQQLQTHFPFGLNEKA